MFSRLSSRPGTARWGVWAIVMTGVLTGCADDGGAGCHRDGAIAPFPLLDYADAAARADLMAGATSTRTMPPMGLDNSGDCRTYRDARWLSDAEIDVFDAWAAAGAPEGDPAMAPEPPAAPRGLARVDAELGLEAPYTPPPDRDDDYRCFVVDASEARGRFLTGYEVIPGRPEIVHHVILYSLPDVGAEAAARSRDAADEGPGYRCFGDAGVQPSEPLAVWAPGTGPVLFPEGTGVRVPGNAVVLQVHYNVRDGVGDDDTAIALELGDDVDRPARFELVANFALFLPPREEQVEASATSIAPAPVTIYGGIPHMHELGRSLDVQLTRADGGDQECLFDVFDWNFDWQGLWFWDEPVEVRADDRVRLTCRYDTRSRNEATFWGDGTEDEMCLVYMYVSN